MASQKMAVREVRARHARWLLASVAMMIGALLAPVQPAGAAGGQFTFFDGTLTHRSSEYAEATQLPEVPADWRAPVDYANGRLYVRLDVTRPTSKAVNVQLCIWRNRFTEETCARQAPLVEDGVQWVDFGRPASWWKKGGSWSWGSRFDPVRLMLKDAATGELLLSSRCGAACYTGGDLEEHLPIVLEASAIVVAAGATLAPPPSWAGCPPEWSPGCVSGDTNAAPVVNAGEDLSATTGVPIAISGTAADDGRPEGSVLTTGWTMASGPGTVTFSADTPDTTAVFSAPGAYVVRLTASDGVLTTADTARVTVTDPLPPVVGTAALLSRSAVPPVSDQRLRDRLRSLGYEVTIVDDNVARTTDLTSFDLVVIAPTVGTSLIPATFASLEVPLLSLKPQIHRRLSLGTGGTLLSGQTTLDIVADHPVAAGLSGPTVVTRSASIGRAVPVAGAVVVARPLNRPGDATIFAIETGTSLVSGVAPARRVGYYLSAGGPNRLNEAGWLLFDAAVGWLVSAEPPAPDPWHVENLSRRSVVTVNPQGVVRTGGVAPMPITADSAGVFDPATLRVIEVDAVGAVLDDTVARQFDPAAGFDGDTVRSGTLLIDLEGSTLGNRRYHVYYGDVGEEVAPPVEAQAQVVLTEGVIDEGQPSLLVETPAGDWYYHTLGGGFSSLVDVSGRDWIGWNPTPGSAGTFRGIPNAVFPAGYLKPGLTNSTTEVVASGPLQVSFETVTDNGAYRVRWDITARGAKMTMLEAAANYWFLYEGTPGGEIDGRDRVIRSSGVALNLTTPWVGDVRGEWVAFADTADGRSLVVNQMVDDTLTDSYSLLEGNMTVFGFGRTSLNSLLSGPRVFGVDLVDATSRNRIRPLVAASRTPYTVAANSAEVRPAE